MSEISQKTEKERRAAPRVRALKKATIAFKDRYCSAECMIKNESETGALLMISQNHVIPNIFELKAYPGRDFRIVEAIWRTPDAMGIRYADQVPAAPIAPIAKPATPVAEPAAPVAAPAAPSAPVAASIAPSAPVDAPIAPVADPAAPVAASVAPSAPVDAPSAPIAKPAAPVAERAAPVAEPSAPVVASVAPRVPVDVPSVPADATSVPVNVPSAPVDAPKPHSTWDGIERRKQNRRENDRRR